MSRPDQSDAVDAASGRALREHAPEESLRASVAALEQSRRVFDMMLSAITDFTYILDADGRFVFANKPLLELWGLTLEQALGKNFLELKYPLPLAERLQRQIRQVVDTGERVADETPYTSPTGAGGYYEYIFSPVFAADGSVEAVAGTTRAITGRKRAEDELRTSQERLTLALDAAELGTFYCPMPLGRIEWNRQCKEHFWLPPDAEVDFDLFYSILHPDDRERTRQAVERAVFERTGYDIEYRTVSPDGRERWVRAIGRGFYDNEGNPTRFDGVTMDVTARHRAEAERERLVAQLETERSRLTTAFRQSPAFLAIMRGPEHVFEFVNDQYYRLVGHRDHVGKPVRLALPEVAGQGYFELLDRVYASGEPFVGKDMALSLQRRPDQPSELRYVEFVYQPIREADGSVSGILLHGIDTTERKRAEVRDQLLVSLDDAVRSLTDPDEVTAACARLLGEHLGADRCAYADVEADEDTFNLVGDYNRGVPSIVGRYRFADFGAEVLQLMRADEPYVVEDIDTHQPPVGDLSYYRQTLIQSVICVPLHKGRRFVAAMAVHQRVARRWSADEVELVRAVAARCWESIERGRVVRVLRQSEAEFRHLADAMPQIVWAARPDGVLDYYNRRWFEYVNLPERAGDDATWDRHLHPDDLPQTYATWQAALRSGEPYMVEFRVKGRQGAYRWFLARAIPIANGDGEIVRWFGTCTDIHDQKLLQEQNERLLESERAARAEAERTSRIKDDFLATLSHELRTPLNAILGWSQILQNPSMDAADLAEGLETIERNARAQTQIIEDLLDMSRIISGKIRLDVRRIDLAAVVQAGVDTVRPAADAKGIELRVDSDRRAATVYGDPNRLQQVVWNLVSNAVKFTARGGRVRVALEPVDGYVVVSVADTGQGIKPEFLPHVFDRFRQADASTTRRHGGLGLGLSIVQQLVELHGGRVQVASAGEGRGSTFTVSLPLTIAPSRSGPDLQPDEQPAPAPSGLSSDLYRNAQDLLAGVAVVVVDDEADARELVKRLLEDCSATVTTAKSVAEAVRLVEATRPDVLVSDIGMPGEDGYSLIARVRALGTARGGDVPAVALTAYARAEDRVRAVMAGFQTHVVKPVEPAELITMVASLAGRTGPTV